MEPKFKIGDYVRIKDECKDFIYLKSLGMYIDSIFKIIDLENGDDDDIFTVLVLADNTKISLTDICIVEDELELVNPLLVSII